MPKMSEYAKPKSDQVNAADFMQPITVLITGVGDRADASGKVSIYIEHLKPWKPCKTMLRLMIAMWGDEGNDWVGHKLTLYNEGTVKFGGKATGGIRISHATGIRVPFEKALMSSKTAGGPQYEQHRVLPLNADAPTFGRGPDHLDEVCGRLKLSADQLDEWMNEMGKPKLSMAPADDRERVGRWLSTDKGAAKLEEWRAGRGGEVEPEFPDNATLQQWFDDANPDAKTEICAASGLPLALQVGDLSDEQRATLAQDLVALRGEG